MLTEIKKKIGNSSISSISNKINSVSNLSSESYTTNEKLKINKVTQTPENIPEPDYNNPILSSLANLGKLIGEKNTKSHSLQIGDVINCIGEFIKQNQKKNGWILLEFPVQPLQMALLEYKLMGKIPPYGRKICRHTKKYSCIIPEYQESENFQIPINTYFSYCIKIIRHKNEIDGKKWYDFLQFYIEQNCIQILNSHLSDDTNGNKKAANFLVEMILNEKNILESNEIFTPVNISNEDKGNYRPEFENDKKQISEPSSIITVDNSNVIIINQVSDHFQIISTNLSRNESILTNNTNTALYLCNKWETMENSYTNQIKDSLNSKDNFFEVVKAIKELIINTVNQIIQFDNNCIINLINNYENKSQLLTNNIEKLELNIFELQVNLWDEVDSELEKIIEFIKHTIDQQTTTKNHTLISIYKQLIETELERTTSTLHFLNKYYDDKNQYEITEFNFLLKNINIVDETDKFQTLCLKIINTFENYVNENYELIKINENTWTESVIIEKKRFINQVYRIKASMLMDTTYLIELTKNNLYLEKLKRCYQFKINDINNLCELLKYTANIGKNIKGNIRQISGEFYIDQLSVFEIIYNQITQTHSRNHFNMKQLNTIAYKLLDNVPCFKISIQDLIDALNELCKLQNIYPNNWPKNKDFYKQFLKEIFGKNIRTIDWRDFIVQCMELSYPNIEQILFYRRLFQGYDVGNGTITQENYETTKLWFENESNQYNEAKWLLYDMYQIQNKFNYSHMLLAFCKDKQPEIGLGKSFSLIFGWDPFNSEKIHINLSNYQHEETENDIDYDNSDIQSTDLPYEDFLFNKNIMNWFLITNLKMYINSENQIGNIDISLIVNSVFVLITKQVEPTIIDLFKNNIMDSLYNEVCKFQTKDLSEVAKTIVMKYYNSNIHNI